MSPLITVKSHPSFFLSIILSLWESTALGYEINNTEINPYRCMMTTLPPVSN